MEVPEEELKNIEEWSGDYHGLMEYVRKLWLYADSGYWNKNDNTYKISTGGWSGNEELIDALQANKLFWLFCWLSSRRGGHFEFEIPKGK